MFLVFPPDRPPGRQNIFARAVGVRVWHKILIVRDRTTRDRTADETFADFVGVLSYDRCAGYESSEAFFATYLIGRHADYYQLLSPASQRHSRIFSVASGRMCC